MVKRVSDQAQWRVLKVWSCWKVVTTCYLHQHEVNNSYWILAPILEYFYKQNIIIIIYSDLFLAAALCYQANSLNKVALLTTKAIYKLDKVKLPLRSREVWSFLLFVYVDFYK